LIALGGVDSRPAKRGWHPGDGDSVNAYLNTCFGCKETFSGAKRASSCADCAYAKRVYVAGPMRGIVEFNFPAFNAAAEKLRAEGHTVFNPAERDIERHGVDISKGNATGDVALAAAQHGFDLRVALGEDLAWICKEADAVALLPGWIDSKGARAEFATAHDLGLEVIFL
jgi:hypothetical protein